jgi:hypothetical protein
VRQVEPGRLAEHRFLKVLKRRARLDPELVDEQTPCIPIHAERFRLSAGAIERQHELSARPFAQWMLADEYLELPDELDVASEIEVCLDAPLDRSQAQLFEAKDLGLREWLVREVGESRPAPDAERIAEQSRGLVGRGQPCLLDEPLEAKEVELVRLNPQDVAGHSGDDSVASDALAQL